MEETTGKKTAGQAPKDAQEFVLDAKSNELAGVFGQSAK